MTKMKIGFVGLGSMGTPMVKNLLSKGFPVTVYNRTRQKEKELVQLGATSAQSLEQLSQVVDVVVTMVTDDEAVANVYNVTDGLLAKPTKGMLMIDVSTVSTQMSKKLSADCKNRGVRFLEAKVSGSVKPAEDGLLLIMAGGTDVDYKQALPFFEAVGKISFHLGEVGIASAAKLCLNYFLGVTLQGLAETVLFAQQLKIHTADILTLIDESALASGITWAKSQPILSNNFAPAFALKNLTKDLKLVQNEGMGFPLFTPLLESFKLAMDRGYGDEDVISIIKALDENNPDKKAPKSLNGTNANGSIQKEEVALQNNVGGV